MPRNDDFKKLKRLRCLKGCRDTVIEFFFARFGWTAIELESHTSRTLAQLPLCCVELRLSSKLLLNEWLALVERGKQGLQLLRDLWLGVEPVDSTLRSKLLHRVFHDESFVVYGLTGDIQWYSVLNLWAQTCRKKDLGKRNDVSGAIRIVKQWKKQECMDECPRSTMPKLASDGVTSSKTNEATMRKVYVCPGRR